MTGEGLGFASCVKDIKCLGLFRTLCIKTNNISIINSDRKEEYLLDANEESLRPRRPSSNSGSVSREDVLLLASFNFNKSLVLPPENQS